jgi:hypothetical protein
MKTIKFLLVILVSIAIAACGGGGGGSANSTGNNHVATAVKAAAPLANCPNGGITVDGGIDSNGNNVLDPVEVTSTQYVCNGTNSNGLTTLVLITNEAAGVNCATGGRRIDAGQDANGNAVLDAAEILSTAYVCNGTNGTSGTNGTNGTNGLNSLMSIVSEPVGAFCTYGGNKVSNGVDSNSNGILDALEITSGSYVCNGAPGANGTNGTNGTNGSTGPAGPGVTWVNVTGTSAQAAANTGYLANNAAQVTITLPAAPVLGDLVSVTGVGAGGWKVAQNAGQSILNSNMIGVNWTPHEDVTKFWSLVASSADGTKLVAISGDPAMDNIHTSIDSGVTWSVTNSASNNYTSVAMSTDGTKMFAWAKWGDFYISTNSGASWAKVPPVTPGFPTSGNVALASSADGTKLVLAKNGGQIYTSTDFGVNWTLQANSVVGSWTSVASSADGTKLAAVGSNVYTSTDSGVTWTLRNLSNLTLFPMKVASSADGTKLVFVQSGSQIYTSTDSGVTWTPREAVRNWTSVASSADGTRLAASVYGGQLYISTDSGMSWTPHASTANWKAVAMSADGFRMVAAGNLVPIYTSVSNTVTGIAGSLSGGQYDAVDLQCVGNNTFVVRDYAGALLMQ